MIKKVLRKDWKEKNTRDQNFGNCKSVGWSDGEMRKTDKWLGGEKCQDIGA